MAGRCRLRMSQRQAASPSDLMASRGVTKPLGRIA